MIIWSSLSGVFDDLTGGHSTVEQKRYDSKQGQYGSRQLRLSIHIM